MKLKNLKSKGNFIAFMIEKQNATAQNKIFFHECLKCLVAMSIISNQKN